MTLATESRPVRSMATTKPAPRVSIGLQSTTGTGTQRGLFSASGTDLLGLELIICDNASTDGTADICRAYAAEDERIAIIATRRTWVPPATST